MIGYNNIYLTVKGNNFIVFNNARYMLRSIRKCSGIDVPNSKPSEMR
jgi:hypothetical protein